jgi:hypothetical protein
MDVQLLIEEAKARFSHNSAKEYLKEKYESLLLVADQNGLWKADLSTITFLQSSKNKEVVLIDTFKNPVKVDRKKLLEVLTNQYHNTMEEWYNEWKNLESKR